MTCRILINTRDAALFVCGSGSEQPSGRERERRGPAPSVPDWRTALYTALVAVEMLALAALLVVLEPSR